MKTITPSFPLIGNDRAVDFVNTRIMTGNKCVDLLETPEALRDWLAVVDLPLTQHISAPDHTASLDLRNAIAGLFAAFRQDETPPGDLLALINNHLSVYSTPQTLVFGSNGYHLTDADIGGGLSRILAILAHDAAVLLTETPRRSLRACASEKCVLIFKDNSKGQRRRWCSMETCGNRAKAAKHYRQLSGG